MGVSAKEIADHIRKGLNGHITVKLYDRMNSWNDTYGDHEVAFLFGKWEITFGKRFNGRIMSDGPRYIESVYTDKNEYADIDELNSETNGDPLLLLDNQELRLLNTLLSNAK